MAERRVSNREQNKASTLPFRRMELIDLQRDGGLQKQTESCGERRWKITSDGCCKIHELCFPNKEANVRVTLHKKHAANDIGNSSGIDTIGDADDFVLSVIYKAVCIRNEAQKPERCSWTLPSSDTVLETTFGNIHQIAWLYRV